ncbi:hypothetical protein Tco_1068828 [Tanacetum coccineum]|uniref:Uncharacterized protein n=1 Tax=Tanacetum coccineum TaxID=301880 RepID=A0ABQ5HH11_9ASTR
MQGVSKTDFENYVKANDVVLRNMQNQGQGLQNQMTNLTEMLSKFITSNTASSSNSGTLPRMDIQEKDKKKAKNGQNRARNEKDKVKSKPKSEKVKSQPSEENTT